MMSRTGVALGVLALAVPSPAIALGLHESVISSMSFDDLRARPREELKASQVHDALDVELPEASVGIVLA